MPKYPFLSAPNASATTYHHESYFKILQRRISLPELPYTWRAWWRRRWRWRCEWGDGGGWRWNPRVGWRWWLRMVSGRHPRRAAAGWALEEKEGERGRGEKRRENKLGDHH
ncbi:hypothetical protein KC19_6G038200 [Ceratodon purpureus]|uniref:Uncharacterized protein n=1 Tax=Ceratodon purpureus TaxID=3225 RepID=A0A8T0HEZ6_CERPU|nr:hypothetical protein KC19_6G038200 [Ceratodon purpureus]